MVQQYSKFNHIQQHEYRNAHYTYTSSIKGMVPGHHGHGGTSPTQAADLVVLDTAVDSHDLNVTSGVVHNRSLKLII